MKLPKVSISRPKIEALEVFDSEYSEPGLGPDKVDNEKTDRDVVAPLLATHI